MCSYTCFTDGAYSSKRQQGGIGIVFVKEGNTILEYSKMIKCGTNNRAEMLAIIYALHFIKKPIESLTIISDSMYCIGTITLYWKRKKNIGLWNIFDIEYNRVKQLCPNIEFKHTKGHQKDDSEETHYNNICDTLAQQASRLTVVPEGHQEQHP